jgi:hypothetical protein
MASELEFPQIIRTGAETMPPCPREIATVEQAIDWVQELPPVTLQGARWKAVSGALWAALDARHQAHRLATAHDTLSAALAAEGWLDDRPH